MWRHKTLTRKNCNFSNIVPFSRAVWGTKRNRHSAVGFVPFVFSLRNYGLNKTKWKHWLMDRVTICLTSGHTRFWLNRPRPQGNDGSRPSVSMLLNPVNDTVIGPRGGGTDVIWCDCWCACHPWQSWMPLIRIWLNSWVVKDQVGSRPLMDTKRHSHLHYNWKKNGHFVWFYCLNRKEEETSGHHGGSNTAQQQSLMPPHPQPPLHDCS